MATTGEEQEGQLAPQNVHETGAPDSGFEKDTLPAAPAAMRTLQPEITVLASVGTTKVAAPPAGHAWFGKGVGAGRGVADAERQ